METSEKAGSASRDAQATRAALLEAAIAIFSENGYKSGSVRRIAQRAGANPAAINYHFGGKEGLYREVLETAENVLEKENFLDSEELDRMTPEEALRLYLLRFLSPLVKRDRANQYLQLCAWERVHPSALLARFVEARPPYTFRLAYRVTRRFLPDHTPADEIALRALWLAQQPNFFLREAERLSRPPFGLTFDQDGVERLVARFTALNLTGLMGAKSASVARPEGTSRRSSYTRTRD